MRENIHRQCSTSQYSTWPTRTYISIVISIMDELNSQSMFESQRPPMEVRPVFDIVYHHSVREQPGEAETASASETMTVRLGDLTDVSQSWWFREDTADSLITLRISHRYLKTMWSLEKSSDPLGETGLDSAERLAHEFPLAPVANQDGSWSNALFDLIRSDYKSSLLSEDTKSDENAFVDLNQFCYFCQQLCKISRTFNTYIDEEDAAMPRQKRASNASQYFDSKLPQRHAREYFDFWSSSEHMLLSARKGCHLCTIICHRLIERLDRYNRFGCVEHDLKLSSSTSLAELHANHNSSRCGEAVPSSGPVELVVCRMRLLPGPCVVHNLYMAWPLKGPSNSSRQGSCFLRSQQCVALEYLDVDAARRKSQILSEIQRGPWMPRESPELGTGIDHLLSHYTGSDSLLNLAGEWLSACHREHSCHQGPSCTEQEIPFRPTRLLDVGDSDGIQNPRLDIKQSTSGRVQYLALSHCWGRNLNNFYKLTKETEEELLQGVRVEKLSRTFQDAVKVCRKLNQRYIWIDSLCIKQDSPEDWIQEAGQMHLVYANSYCTIAAVCARGDEEGFLRSRNPRRESILSISNISLGFPKSRICC